MFMKKDKNVNDFERKPGRADGKNEFLRKSKVLLIWKKITTGRCCDCSHITVFM